MLAAINERQRTLNCALKHRIINTIIPIQIIYHMLLCVRYARRVHLIATTQSDIIRNRINSHFLWQYTRGRFTYYICVASNRPSKYTESLLCVIYVRSACS